MRVAEPTLGVIVILGAVTMAVLATRLPGGAPGNYGPEVFPLLISAIAILAGLGLIVRGRRAEPPALAETPADRPNWLRGLAVTGSLVYALFALPVLGFMPTILPVLVVLMAAFGVRWVVNLPVAVLCTLAIKYVFTTFLAVPLPAAPFLPF